MDDVKQLSGEEGLKKLGSLIAKVHIAMLTTLAPDGSFDSRPMATQREDFSGVLWFLTRRSSEKVQEIGRDSHASVLYADPSSSTYVAVKGRAQVVQDPAESRAKIDELWNSMYKAWFPAGKADPEIAVLRVEVLEAEYWDASSSKIIMMMRYLAAAATGGKVSVGEEGKVSLRK